MTPLKQRLAQGEFVAAAWTQLNNPDVAEIMVRHGWRTILIDGEHGTGGLEDWVAVARAVEAAGGEVILRVPDRSETMLKQVLDRGFSALVVPMVNSAGEAEDIAAACRYPPHGRRGYAAGIVRASHYGARAGYAKTLAHDDLLLFVQCEHPDSVAALPEIAGVEGIDGVFLGPFDLSAMMGHLEDMSHEAPLAAYAQVEATCAEAGVLMATVPSGGRGWADLKARGFLLVVGGSDVVFLVESAQATARERDSALGADATQAAANP